MGQNQRLGDRGDISIGKMLALQAKELEFDHWNPCEKSHEWFTLAILAPGG